MRVQKNRPVKQEKENSKIITIEEDIRIPGTKIILEKGDKIEVLNERDEYWAVVQPRYAVFGVGDSYNQAIENAYEWMDDIPNQFIAPIDNITEYKEAEMYGGIVIAPCTKELYNKVKKDGGDIIFDYNEDLRMIDVSV